MRTLRQSTAPEAAEAIALFVYRIVREIGSLAAALGGLDGVVFTARHRRERSGDAGGGRGRLRLAGTDARCRAQRTGRGAISADGAAVTAWVVPTDEERMIARYTGETLGI